MSTQAVTPDANANPFDTPLPSEVNEHQQAVAASATGNPFDEPLPSEKAEQQAANSDYIKKVNTTWDSPAGQAEKAMGESMGDNKAQAIVGVKSFGNAALQTAGGVLGAGPLASAADAVVPAAIAHLGSLTKIVQAAKTLGWASFGLKEAHDLYKMVSGGSK